MEQFTECLGSYRRGCRCFACRAVRATWQRAYDLDHKPQKAERQRAHYLANKEKTAARNRANWLVNKEKLTAYHRAYRLANPARMAAHMHRYRARIAGAPGEYTLEQLQARIDFYGGLCYLCGGPYEHIDHVIPLDRGGSNWPANLRPACASCNHRKHTKTLKEFLARRIVDELPRTSAYRPQSP